MMRMVRQQHEIQRESVDRWKVVANKLMRGDTVLPVAHHRSEADVVEEVCGNTDPIHEKSVINSHVHHRQL